MSFLPEEPTTFINIKLTDTGRRLLSLGRLTYDKAALSDREINYGFDRQVTGGYDIQNNRVIGPKDDHPTFTNFDGSDFMPLGPARVHSVQQIASADTNHTGFISGNTKSGFVYDESLAITSVEISYTGVNGLPGGTNLVDYIPGSPSVRDPEVGELIYIPWEPIQNSGKTYNAASTEVDSDNATNNLWYRIVSANTNTLYLDRNVPDFGSAASNQTIKAYVYPYNGIETYYGSASTVNVGVWNMNIIRTSDVIGTESTGSGYTTYGSIEYNGVKNFFRFSSETKEFGVIHYSNEYTGNTYAEQLVEKTVEMHIPDIMWHKTNADVGKGVIQGVTLYDKAGITEIDPANNAPYRMLKDSTSTNGLTVGRVYHTLKMVVITDSELLTAMTYKSNRVFTLPRPNLTLTTVPKFPLTTSDATGLCVSGRSYYVTYNIESDASTSGVSFGYPQTLPCSYVEKIEGEFDTDGNPSYLTVNFPPSSFPFMRSSADMEPGGSFSGTGWNANKVQLMVNEVWNVDNKDFDTIPVDGWVLLSSGSTGNGVYTGDTSDLTIDPLKLQAFQFTVSREDYLSGTTYTLPSDFTSNIDVANSGLTFGNESFFYGSIKTGIRATSFKTSITILADNTRFNSSQNQTYNSVLDEDTYITEIGVFNQDNELVAVGKPTFPLKKSDGRFLAFKLELDF